jgi:elongation factor 1 alpha-like protein
VYAWVLDETEEERTRGITMDCGTNKFETENRIITLLDAPGHKDFIPNMISGAYQADVAVLVVNSTTGEFEAGFDAGGQTREHALLVRSLGISQLVIAVNKLDTVNWDKTRFADIKQKLSAFLTKQAGFREKDLNYVPCSGLTGENLSVESTTPELISWYKGPSLIKAIDVMKTPERAIEKPFRMSISDIFKGQSAGVSVVGRVESGCVLKEDRLLCTPINEVCVVKSVLVEQMDGHMGYAGDHVTLNLTGPDQAVLAAGQVLCDPTYPIPVTSKFRARIVVFSIDIPITKGYPIILHYGCVSEQATISKLVSTLNKSTGEVLKNKPRFLTGNCSAMVDIMVSKPIPLETYKDNRELGRFMMRVGGNTIAAGMVTQIL